MSDQLNKNYDVGALIGRGRFGAVFRCVSQTSGELFAVKSIDKALLIDPLDYEPSREAKLHRLAAAGNPLAVQIHADYEDDESIHLVLDFCPGPNLFHHIADKGAPISEPEAATLMGDLMEAILACHRRGVVHRDVKPENAVFDGEGRIRIVDFGSAGWIGDGGGMREPVGTPYYMAPEVGRGEVYGEKVDVWSAGVVLFTMIGGLPPSYCETSAEIFEAVRWGSLRFPSRVFSGVSSAAKDLLERMICKEVSRRFSAEQVLRHPWIKSRGGTTNSVATNHARMPDSGEPLRKKVRAGSPISFSDDDVEGVHNPHNDPLVVTVTIGKCKVSRVFINIGSSADVIFWEAFEKMGLGREPLKPVSSPLIDFNGAAVQPEGMVTLPVTVGSSPQQSTVMVNFLIIKCYSRYNAMLGRPSLNALRAAISTYHFLMKFPTETGCGILRGNHPQNDALVVTVTIGKRKVGRVLINIESSANVMFWEVYDKMGLGLELLKPVRPPLIGFTVAGVQPKGTVTLPLTVGSSPQQSTVMAKFLIIKCYSCYNLILGRPSLNALKAAISTDKLLMEFPTKRGRGILRVDQPTAH